MARLVISLFGSFQVHLDSQPVTHFESDKVRALLAYLAVEADRPHRRERLAGLLWPDLPESAARHNLSQSLLRLRQAIGDRQATPPFLLITSQTIQFNPAADSWLDVAALRTQTAASANVEALAQAVAHYAGDFLAGFYGIDSDLFEEWVLAKREELRRHALLMLDRLVAQYEEQGAYDLAQQYARQQLDLDSLREESHRRLMHLLALSGRRSEAMAQYLTCQRILADELAVEPAPETTALYEAIRNAEPPFQSGQRFAIHDGALKEVDTHAKVGQTSAALWPHRFDQGEMPEAAHFFGRTAEKTELTRWLTVERCRLVALLGIGGVGKTSLAAQVVNAVAGDFEYVIWRTVLNAPLPGEIVAEWLDFLSDEPAQQLPDSLDGQVRRLLNVLRQRRVLLILDNVESIMQTGDRAGGYRPGYETYGQLLRRVGESAHQSCLLLTSREKPQEFSHLERGEGPVRSQQLHGLTTNAGQEMLRAEGVDGPAAAVNNLVHRYSGNPLALRLIAETIRDLFAGDIQHFLRQEQPFFDDMEVVLGHQFARLSAIEVEIMTWLAIEREAVEADALRANLVHPISSAELLGALRSLTRRSLIDARGVAFALQNVIMEYTTTRLVNQVCEELATWQHSLVELEGAVTLLKNLAVNSVAGPNPPPTNRSGAENLRLDTKPDIVESTFNRHSLLKAQAKAYIGQSQRRLILQPVAERLLASYGVEGVAALLKSLLQALREAGRRRSGYAGGNVLNLLLHLAVDCRSYDFSDLCVWQADLQGKTVQGVNFSGADLRGSAFMYAVSELTTLVFSPDGQLLATAADDGFIWLWRTATGEPVTALAGHADFVTTVCFSPDGAFLASASGDRLVCLWDMRQPLEHSRPVRTFQGHSYDITGLTFDHSGAVLASISVDCVLAWDVQGGVERLRINELGGRGETLAWSPDGRWLAVSIDEKIALWDAPATLATERAQVRQYLYGHGEQIIRLAFSADSQYLLSASEDKTARVWRVADGACVHTLAGHRGSVRGLAIDPSDNFIATGSADRSVLLWRMDTGERLKALHGHSQTVMSVAFAPDGQTLASGAVDQSVRFWDVRSGHLLRTIQGHTRLIHAVAFSPRGDYFACAVQDGSARLWHAQERQERRALHGHQGLTWRVAFSPDGELLASGGYDGAICLWSVTNGQLLSRLPPHAKRLASVVFSPDKRTLASGGYGGTLRLWDVQTGELLEAWSHPQRLGSLAYHPGGELLAATCYDTLIYLWDVPRRCVVRKLAGHRYEAWGLCFSPDGSVLASSSDDQTIRLWDPETGVCKHILRGHSGTVQSLAFHPQGRYLASASQDRTIRLWDITDAAALAASQPAHTLTGHQDRVTGLAFHPDGRLLLSSSSDQTMRLWELQSALCVETMHIRGPYAGTQIAGVRGLSPAQVANLKLLGAGDAHAR